jgi:hypothetical protein
MRLSAKTAAAAANQLETLLDGAVPGTDVVLTGATWYVLRRVLRELEGKFESLHEGSDAIYAYTQNVCVRAVPAGTYVRKDFKEDALVVVVEGMDEETRRLVHV